MRTGRERMLPAAACMTAAVFGLAGCGGDARLELSAADALTAAADRMEIVVAEYHAEMDAYDGTRESAVVEAFVERLKSSAGDERAMADHAVQFRLALERVRQDRAVQWQRHTAALENVAAVREVAEGLRRMGIESLTLSDEMRRYLSRWTEARRQAAMTTAAIQTCGAGKECDHDCK
ncbi:MAG: hypothetical protein ACUVXJ_12155 [Phycisphaerae bacterium]